MSMIPALYLSAADEGTTQRLSRLLVETAAFVGMGIVAFAVAFFIIAKLSPFSMKKEIAEDQNVALGIIIGSVIIGLAMIISAAIHG